MDYTKQQHALELGAAQEMLAGILELCEEHTLSPNMGKVLVGTLSDGTLLHIEHKSPAPRIAFLALEILGGLLEKDAMNVEYYRDSKRVGDSTEFNAKDVYVRGHIQVWMNPQPEEDLQGYKAWFGRVQSVSDWHLEQSK